MGFQASDVYTTSGDVKLWNSWTQNVSKYDASSFYNWEQDNLPLYDIEERTYANWEQHGFPTSCVPGFVLAVSADATAADLECNRNLFTTVSGAIEALPQHIRFPVVIEVASHQDLNDLKLHNIKMGYRGSLEIINRNYAKIYSASADVTTTATTGHITSFTSENVSSTFAESSALSISSTVLSAVEDERFIKINTIASVPGYGTNGQLPCKLSVGIKRSAQTTNANKFLVNYYDQYTTDATIHTEDVSSVNQMTGAVIDRDKPATGGDVVGMIYGNAFDSISVKNCDGPIYIRNFFADGEGVREIPILIENSNVFLENCAAVRGLEAGVKFVNSKSVISRGLTAYRNYGLSGFGARVDNYGEGVGLKLVNSEVELSHERVSLDEHGKSNSAWDSSSLPQDFLLNFSRNNYGIKLENSVLRGGTAASGGGLALEPSYLQCERNVKAGMVLHNSKFSFDGRLDVYNNNYGIRSYNSEIKLNQLTVEGNSRIGYHGVNSKFTYNKDLKDIPSHAVTRDWIQRAQIEFLKNGQNIKLEGGSVLEPRYSLSMPSKYGEFLCASSHGNLDDESHVVSGDLKGQSPIIEITGGSTGRFVHLKGLRDDVYNNNDPGTDSTSYGDIVLVTNGSEANFHGSKEHATIICGPPGQFKQYNKAGVCAKNNSSVKFSGPTFIAQYGVDVLATDNSVASFGPPFRNEGGEFKDHFDLSDTGNHTSIELHATRSCLVADNGSVINIEDLGDFSGVWARSPSYGTGIAAGYNYTNFSPMASACSAGSMQFYPNPAENDLGGATTASATDDLGAETVIAGAGKSNTVLTNAGPATFTGYTTNGTSYNAFLENPLAADFDNEAWSLGGMCVRVLNGSKVNVRNTHFLTGYSHAPSGAIYDVSSGINPADSGKCQRLFIWNVDDTSELTAELVSVSSLNPGEEAIFNAKGYHGPTAYWTSSSDDNIIGAAFGCPSGTPDTGAFSILDHYGRGQEAHLILSSLSAVEPYKTIFNGVPVESSHNILSAFTTNYGYPTHKNLGPFRIYHSVDPAVNKLAVAVSGANVLVGSHNAFNLGGILGPAKQLLSQGYSLSGSASAVSVSGDPEWDSLKQFTGNRSPEVSGFAPSSFATSGYYYTKDFVAQGFTRIFLDESASNMFANAKNASTGKSNRPKLVTIFDSRRLDSGDDMSASSIWYGTGIRSLNNFDLNKRN
jgi:hypothetical protein